MTEQTRNGEKARTACTEQLWILRSGGIRSSGVRNRLTLRLTDEEEENGADTRRIGHET